jgi:DNA invertase Pin-like site-specific DNA recombinase
MKKACLYARYSLDKQSPESLEDQWHVCEKIAKRDGFIVVARFGDREVSGGTAQRHEYQAMLDAARQRKFDVVIVEDVSRLWRSRAEFGPRSAELEDLGIHMITAVGDDTRRDGWGLTIQVKLAMAEHQRREVSYRTRRGLEGLARKGQPTGGRAYGYIAASDSDTEQREIHPEQAQTVRQIFQWHAEGRSPRWIARELNRRDVPSPGSSWNRTSERLNAKRRRGWVPSAIDGDRSRGTGILNNSTYIGKLTWGRSVWKRSAADSKQRRCEPNDPTNVVSWSDERLRIVPQDLWDSVKARQQAIHGTTVKLRSVINRNGRLPSTLLSRILRCEKCGGAFRCVNGREYGCASHRDGGEAACTNGIRVPILLAESRLLKELVEELLTPEAIALLERRIDMLARQPVSAPQGAAVKPSKQVAEKMTEIKQLRKFMKAGTLSQTVALAALEKAEDEMRSLQRAQTPPEEKPLAKTIGTLPLTLDALRDRISRANLGLRDRHSILEARNVVWEMLGGHVMLRPAETKPGERPYLVARVGPNRDVPLDAPLEARPAGDRRAQPPTHCGKGHALMPSNLALSKGGTQWRCRQCGADRAAVWRRRKSTARNG